MTPQQFVAKWQKVTLSERSACQQHFLDLCELLGQEKPAAADPEGTWYTFELGCKKSDGGDGWADVCDHPLTRWTARAPPKGSNPPRCGHSPSCSPDVPKSPPNRNRKPQLPEVTNRSVFW